MARKDFHHPFEPYEIQQQFMEALYECIEQGNVGIFESPTGTGKSLSLICGSLTWLREHKRQKFDEALATVQTDSGEPDWMLQQAKEIRKREICQLRSDFEARLAVAREREQKIRKDQKDGQPHRKRQKRSENRRSEIATEEEFLLDDYDEHKRPITSLDPVYSSETTKLMESLGMLCTSPQGRNGDKAPEETKIYFCSRTHSQLSQLIGELRRVEAPSAFPADQKPVCGDTDEQNIEQLKHLTLGSRKNLCINPTVNRLPSQAAVNERCIELQQSKTPADQKCQLLPNKDSELLMLDFRDSALSKIRDIEDLANVGLRLQICPYYASRPAIGPAEVITLPYPLLLQKSAREALGISLKGNIVIIDEAHNLVNAIEGINSAQISEAQLKRIREALLTYLHKFRNRLRGGNRMYLTQTVRVVDSLLQFTAGVQNLASSGDCATPEELLSGNAVDQINLAKLVQYITESKLARKIEGYSKFLEQTKEVAKEKPGLSYEPPPLTQFHNFLPALMNPSGEGTFLWSKENGDILIRYLLLNSCEHFREVVEDSRAVVLAGGTMSPLDDYKEQLFPYLPAVTTFSCGHLIPPSSLLVRTITADAEGRLEFSFRTRTERTMIRLGRALLQVLKVVQGGSVIFFPSYSFLESVLQCWHDRAIAAELESLRPVFYDSRNGSAEEIFKQYGDAITSQGSAILFSVIGGKLSEGINFSDQLGRCVIIVGMPYPNLETPEWKARMRYLNERSGKPTAGTEIKAGREHVENMCMRSVNQAIGRAIRHQNDWASIVLLDARYESGNIRSKLPAWIRASVDPSACTMITNVVADLGGFFPK